MNIFRGLLAGLFAVVLPAVAVAQSSSIIGSGTLPANCTATRDVYLKSGTGAGFYVCLATDTWSGPLLLSIGSIALDDLSDVDAATPNDGDVLTFVNGSGNWEAVAPAGGGGGDRSIGISLDGGGDAITTGVKGYGDVAFAGTITAATLLTTDASCSLVIDVWLDSYANAPPTNDDSITASAPPTLSTANKSQDTTLTGWSTTITAGDVIGFNVDSGDCTQARLSLTVEE